MKWRSQPPGTQKIGMPPLQRMPAWLPNYRRRRIPKSWRVNDTYIKVERLLGKLRTMVRLRACGVIRRRCRREVLAVDPAALVPLENIGDHMIDYFSKLSSNTASSRAIMMSSDPKAEFSNCTTFASACTRFCRANRPMNAVSECCVQCLCGIASDVVLSVFPKGGKTGPVLRYLLAVRSSFVCHGPDFSGHRFDVKQLSRKGAFYAEEGAHTGCCAAGAGRSA